MQSLYEDDVKVLGKIQKNAKYDNSVKEKRYDETQVGTEATTTVNSATAKRKTPSIDIKS